MLMFGTGVNVSAMFMLRHLSGDSLALYAFLAFELEYTLHDAGVCVLEVSTFPLSMVQC
jgi:hypothetical protein